MEMADVKYGMANRSGHLRRVSSHRRRGREAVERRARRSRLALTWRNVSGSGSRQLLRHIDRTDAVHRFAAALPRRAREGSWKAVHLDPPRRASRYLSLGGGLRSVRPREHMAWQCAGQPVRPCVQPLPLSHVLTGW